jgi:hypothetical protein
MRAPGAPIPELVKIEADRLKAEMPEVVDGIVNLAGKRRAELVERLLKTNVWNALADIDPRKAAILFKMACFSVLRGTVTRAELAAEAGRMQATVKNLHEFACGLDHQDPREQVLRDAAKALNQISVETLVYDGPLVVERKRAGPTVRAYATILSSCMIETFGQPHDKVVARIATAALGQEVYERNVASWREQDRNRSS